MGALRGAGIGVENEALLVITLHQDHADVGHALGINGRECHGIRIIRLGSRGVGEPLPKQIEGLLRRGEVTVC